MSRYRPLLLVALLAAGCSGGSSEDSDVTEVRSKSGRTSPAEKFPDDPNVHLDLPYADKTTDPFHKLDLYLPKDAKADTPLLVYVHGGAWIGGDKRLYRFFGEAYRKDGIAVAIVNYRLSSNGSVHVPEHARDVASAIAFLAANKAKYAYNPGAIYLIGHSAGAHTIAMLATDGSLYRAAAVPKPSLPRGYVGLEGIYDVPTISKVHPNYDNWFLLSAFGAKPSWPKGSPTLLPVASKAPWVVVHSRGDNLVEMDQATGFDAHLKKEGVVSTLVTVDGLSHDDVVLSAAKGDSSVYKAVVALMGRQK